MNVIYKVYLNERISNSEFPNLKNEFKREVVMDLFENGHLEVAKLIMKNKEKGVTYSIGKIKVKN
jgi:hypothetical protein